MLIIFMARKRFFKLASTRFLLILLSLILVSSVAYFIWQKKKIGIVEQKIMKAIVNKTDSLYSIRFDSLYFNERTGEAYLQNIHIIP
ncbi:MAG: hypothetical protein ABIQ56_04345, partial [Chitinophagaceae bacterium]